MQTAEVGFQYHDGTYRLVKYTQVDISYWRVYEYDFDTNSRSLQVAEFTDLRYDMPQAKHMAKHLLRMYRLGKEAGRREIKQELKNLVDTEQV